MKSPKDKDLNGSKEKIQWLTILCIYTFLAILVTYLIFPGFLIGIALNFGIDNSKIKSSIEIYMPVQLYCAHKFHWIGRFYEWQIFVIYGKS